MKRLAIWLPILLACMVLPVLAERPTVPVRPMPTTGAFTMGELTPTPDMWFYDQYLRQYQDARQVVRANAEYRAEQRLRRINALKWYGMSNQRPRASVDTLHSDYSAGWYSGSANYPLRWSNPGPTLVFVPK